MVELRIVPIHSAVALAAVGGKARRAMVRIVCPVEIRDMARVARRRRSNKASADMARIAGDGYVRTGQRELGEVVVELRIVPVQRAVARRTVCGQTSGGVRWIVRRIVVLNMATEAIRRRSFITSSDMACRAIQSRMSARQDKSCRAVVEHDAAPGGHVVARLASHRESGGSVVDGGRAVEVVNMARRTLRRQSNEPANRGVDVAGVASHGSMSADQGESRRVLAGRLHAILPALHVVAFLALGAKLTPMYVGMTIRAFRAHVGEDQLRMAQPALHLFVHAAQREFGLTVMVELGNGANRRPTR